jgi:hypothetical protein
MMELFFETKDVFQLKDMEKIAPKEKGITAMSVKEVLQSLVDDGMVDCERLGLLIITGPFQVKLFIQGNESWRFWSLSCLRETKSMQTYRKALRKLKLADKRQKSESC